MATYGGDAVLTTGKTGSMPCWSFPSSGDDGIHGLGTRGTSNHGMASALTQASGSATARRRPAAENAVLPTPAGALAAEYAVPPTPLGALAAEYAVPPSPVGALAAE
ncbi:MAG: hypothetical protein R3335_12240 [Anaerolineales bacterium]|nr:hypothetical protein [Anaerolineales bacterium]